MKEMDKKEKVDAKEIRQKKTMEYKVIGCYLDEISEIIQRTDLVDDAKRGIIWESLEKCLSYYLPKLSSDMIDATDDMRIRMEERENKFFNKYCNNRKVINLEEFYDIAFEVLLKCVKKLSLQIENVKDKKEIGKTYWKYYLTSLERAVIDRSRKYTKKVKEEEEYRYVEKIAGSIDDAEKYDPERFSISNNTTLSGQERMEYEDQLSYMTIQIITGLLKLEETKNTKNYNSKKREFFHMFYTDYIGYICHEEDILLEQFRNEKEIMSIIHEKFLDFIMREKCENLSQIRYTRTKTALEVYGIGYGKGHKKKEDEEVTFHLKNRAYVHFTEVMQPDIKDSSAGVSQKKKAYDLYIKECLGMIF